MGASEENDVEKVAAGLEREADDLQRRSQELGDQIETTRQDWQHKRSDPAVPGAVPEDPDQDAEPPAHTPDQDADA